MSLERALRVEKARPSTVTGLTSTTVVTAGAALRELLGPVESLSP